MGYIISHLSTTIHTFVTITHTHTNYIIYNLAMSSFQFDCVQAQA